MSENEKNYEEVINTFDINEIDLPTNYEEILDDVTKHLKNAIEDLADGVIQIKALSANANNNDLWDELIVKDALSFSSIGEDIANYLDNSDFPKGTNLVDCAETLLLLFYSISEDYTVYALGVEHLVSSILNELREQDEDKYNEVVNYMKDNKISSLKEFTDDEKISTILTRILLTSGGKVVGGPGAVAFSIIKESGIKELFKEDYKDIIKSGINSFLTGTRDGQVATAGSTLLGTLGLSAGLFALGVGWDAIRGEVSWENVAIRGGRTLVGIGSSLVGTSVGGALAGAGYGMVAGPFGATVGVVISLIGNVVIDGIVYECTHAKNGIPYNYEEITIDYIKNEMYLENIDTGFPTVGGESVFEVINELTYNKYNEDVATYLKECSCGISTWPPDKLRRYDEIADIALNYGIGVKDEIDMTPEEEAFADALIELFPVFATPDNENYMDETRWDLWGRLNLNISMRNEDAEWW